MRRGRFVQRKRTPAAGIDHFDAYGLLFRRSQFEERIHQTRAAAAFRAGKIPGGLLDERDKYRVKREIVGEIVEARCEQQNAAFAHFFVEKQRRAIGSLATTRASPGSTRTA